MKVVAARFALLLGIWFMIADWSEDDLPVGRSGVTRSSVSTQLDDPSANAEGMQPAVPARSFRNYPEENRAR
jgi:hypothetical protein